MFTCNMIEFQKRGLPHVHILLCVETKIQPEDVDFIMNARIPDIWQNPFIHDNIIKIWCI